MTPQYKGVLLANGWLGGQAMLAKTTLSLSEHAIDYWRPHLTPHACQWLRGMGGQRDLAMLGTLS